MIYRQPLPLRGFDEDLREAMVEALTAQGIILHPNRLPKKIEADGDRRILTFGDDRDHRRGSGFFRHRPARQHQGPGAGDRPASN